MIKTFHDIDLYRNILKKSMLHFSYVPEYELNEFIDQFYVMFYPKKKDIIVPGTTDIKGYFIISGLVRMHYKIGELEISSDFRDENSFFLNGYTYFAKQKNFDYFTAIEDTICMVIDWDKLEMMLSKYHSLERMGRKMIEWHFCESHRVSYNILFMNTEERFSIFMKERSSLLKRVPLKYIASYLGIATETLSRLRSKASSQPAKSDSSEQLEP